MLSISKVESKWLMLFLSLASVALIGYFDELTGSEFSFSVFYLIPIAFFSIHKDATKNLILLCTIFAAIIWFIVEFNSRSYSHMLIPLWNSFMRLIIFFTTGMLLFYFKEKQHKLQVLNDKLKVSNDEKNRIIGIAAHDIRNPLSAIYSFSDLLLSEEDIKANKESSEIVTLIKSLSEDVLVMIKNLLDISKIESGKLDLKYENQDYINFIKHHIAINQLLSKKKNITINLVSSKNIKFAEFDKHYLGEVISNLLSNAIKYSWKDSEILIRISEEQNNYILTEIIDHGQGIPEDEQVKVFNYFQKTSTQPTDGEQSTGLGLAIVKKIVICHKGKVGLKSLVNKGSNFYFTLPISQSI